MKSLLLILYILGQEYNCIAENVYYEARNQPIQGQIAVAEVTLNRVRSPHWPSSACAVVKQRKQFSWTNYAYEPPYGPAWSKAQKSTLLALLGNKQVNDSVYFHATYVEPYWVEEVNFVTQIGDHKFYAR